MNIFKRQDLSIVQRDARGKRLDHVTVREVMLWCLQVAFTFILIYTAVQLWWPVTPARLDRIEVSKTTIARGEDFSFSFVGEKYKDLPVYVVVELTNGERITLMGYTANNPVGPLTKKRWAVLPYHIIPGQYRIKWTGVYQINALRTITLVGYSDWITVK